MKPSILLTGAAALFPAAAFATIVPILDGTTDSSSWSDLTFMNYPAYPDFADQGQGDFDDLWPAPISPTAGTTADIGFNKVSGGGYPASSAIYKHTVPGTFIVTDASPLADLETVTFQLDMAPGNGFFIATPTLNYNGGTQGLLPDFNEQGAGNFTASFGPDTFPTSLFGYQWDLTSLGTISDFEIVWTAADFSSTYELQLDSSDTFGGNAISAVPEPAAGALLAGLAVVLLATRRRA